jgi:homoserine kinase
MTGKDLAALSVRGDSRATRQAAKIRVPATTSNLGSGFDAVGLALKLYLVVEVLEIDSGPSRLEFSGLDSHLIPTDESNLVWQTMSEVAQAKGKSLPDFLLRIENQIPIAKGLGSSAAAILAGAAAADFLCRLNFARESLLEIAAEREGHPDNAAPALMGGLVVSIGGEKTLCSKSRFPEEWAVVAVTPDYELQTKKARAVLPEQIPHRDAVYNVQRAAFLMAQLAQGRREGLREAMADRLHQPYRSALIPGLAEILELKVSQGMIGVALSGAGSTVIAFADSHAEEIGEEIRGIFSRHHLTATVRLLKADNEGLVISSS